MGIRTDEYIHGTSPDEQLRLNKLNLITNQSFINFLEVERAFRVCDFGCGTGVLLASMAAKYPDKEFVGIEISKEMYIKACENTAKLENVRLYNSNALESGLPDNSFDLVYGRYVLEHVASPVDMLTEMLRVTIPGGSVAGQENDLHNVLYYPEIHGHEALMKHFCSLQVRMGGDPFIGRKLFNLYEQAGAKEICLTIEPEIYTAADPESYRAWMSNSMELFVGARDRLLDSEGVVPEDMDNMLDQFQMRIRQPQGVALFYWNRVRAIKPFR